MHSIQKIQRKHRKSWHRSKYFESNHCTATDCSSNWNWSKQTSADLSSLLNAAQLLKASQPLAQLTNWVISQNKTNKKKLKKGEILKSWNCFNLWAVRHIDFLNLEITGNKRKDVKLRRDISTVRFFFFTIYPSKKEYESLIARKSALEKTQLSDVLITDNLFW